MKKSLLLLSAAWFALAPSAHAQEADDNAPEFNQYGQKVESHTAEAKFQDGIMVLENKKYDLKFWFDIRVQGDAAFYFGGPDFTAKKLNGENNPNHIGNGASLRRTRMAVKTQLGKSKLAVSSIWETMCIMRLMAKGLSLIMNHTTGHIRFSSHTSFLICQKKNRYT